MAGIFSLGSFLETGRHRVERVVEAIDRAREGGILVDADADSHGVVHVSGKGWVKTGKVVSPLGAVCLDVRTSIQDVIEAAEELLAVSNAYVKGMDDGIRARPAADMVEDESYLRGLEAGYEIRFYARPPDDP